MNTNKMTLGSGSKAKLLAAFAVLAVAFVVLAAVPAVDAADGESEDVANFTNLKSAVEANNFNIKLTCDIEVTDPLTITKTGVLDLNGNAISRGDNTWTDVTSNSTITVNVGGKLTINDSSTEKTGAVIGSATTSKAAALAVLNGGTVIINGGTFELVADAINEGEDTGGWYTIANEGSATINGGTFIGRNLASNGSSMIKSGWYDGSAATVNSNDLNAHTNGAKAELTINGGTFKYGLNTVKNDDFGTLTINGGTFSNTAQAVIMNNNVATINGGTFNAEKQVIVPAKYNDTSNQGITAINGGSFDVKDGYYIVEMNTSYNVTLGTVEVKQGVVDGPIVGFKAGVTPVAGSYAGTVKIGSNAVTFKGIVVGDKDVTISEGSVVISGTMDAASVDALIAGDSGDVVLKDLTITAGTLTLDKNIIAKGTITIYNGATLTITKKTTLTVTGTVTGTINNNGTVTALNGGNLNGAIISGTGTITSRTDDSDKENVNIDGTIKGTANEYDADQIVTINGDTKIVAGAVLKINGTLVVKEGVTLTLEAGSKLVIANNAIMDIQGTVVVEEAYGVPGESGYVAPAEFEIRGIVTVYGTLDVNGTVTFATGTVTIEQDGVVDILSEGRIAGVPSAYKFVVKTSGILNVEGSVAAMKIENNGSIIFDSKVASGDIEVYMKNGAVLDVKNITLAKDGTITVTDGATGVSADRNQVNLKVTDAGEKGSAATNITANTSVYATISGISVSESVTSKTVGKTTTSTYVMTVSGSASVSPIYLGTSEEPAYIGAAASVELSGFATTSNDKSKLTIAEGLTIGENITLENKGTLEVTVLVDAIKGTVSNESSGKITVSDSGSIVVKQETISGDANINASKYVVGTTDKTYYYVTLDNAIAAAATGTTKDIKVLGKQTLAESAELVAGATLNIDGATLIIGSGDNASDDVLTIKSEATFKGTPVAPADGKAIDVKGTVYAENKRDIKTDVTNALNAGAAVYSEQMDDRNRPVNNGWAKWTNVYTAMADSTLTVVKLINDITLDKNLTIPEGKILDTAGNDVTAEEEVTVTVEGTLDIGNGSVITLKKVGDDAASIVVKGLIESDSDLDSTDGIIKTSETENGHTTVSKYLPLGAYYAIDGKFCMTTVEKAAAIISTVDVQTVIIKGMPTDKLTVAGDIAFAGKTANEKATVDVKIKEIAFSGSVSLDNAEIIFPAEAKVSGTFTNGSGSVALKGIVPAKETSAETDNSLAVGSATEDGTVVLTVSGKLANISDSDKQTFTVTGAVTVSKIDLVKAVVDGKLSVKEDANAIEDLVINAGGEAVLTKNAKMEKDEGTIVVLGLLDASADGASVSAKIINVGTDGKAYTTGAAAVVNGNVSFTGYSIVVPGSTVPEKYGGNDAKSTEYLVGNGVYVTVYVPAPAVNYKVGMVKASEPNSTFGGWLDANNVDVSEENIGNVSEVYAQFNYDIYNVTIVADSAVDNLYIEGNLMMKTDGGFTATGLSAGTVKITYTLKNGYSGTGTLKIMSDTGGKASVNGDNLTLAGTPAKDKEKVDVTLQLTGFTASGYVDPVTPVTPTEDKDDGLTITDYLLIVLVVLIVIMAVIVAMRLMRS